MALIVAIHQIVCLPIYEQVFAGIKLIDISTKRSSVSWRILFESPMGESKDVFTENFEFEYQSQSE